MPRDAIGSHTRHAQAVLAELTGRPSRIYVGEARGVRPGEVHPYRSFSGSRQRGVALLYQLSTGSPLAGFLAQRPEPKLVDYHNVTPPGFFARWEPQVAVELEAGRRQVGDLADGCLLGLADSAYNEAELRALGYGPTAVAPIMIDPARAKPDRRFAARLASAKERGGAEWLFVGRIAPNKAQHDLVKALAVYRRLYDPLARLTLVGGSSSHAYWGALRRLTAALSLTEAVRMPGSVGEAALAAYYANADVFVCASEHEGLCVPLLEAMHYDLPVVAFGAAAVPETLAGAGLVLSDKEPATLAAAVSRIALDAPLRSRLVSAGRSRLADFSLTRTRARFAEVVGSFLGGG